MLGNVERKVNGEQEKGGDDFLFLTLKEAFDPEGGKINRKGEQLMNGAEIECVKCGRGLIKVSNVRGVRYWEKQLEFGGTGTTLRDGFSQLKNGYFVRVVSQSPKVAEVWGFFPLNKQHRRSICPACMEKLIRERIRKETHY